MAWPSSKSPAVLKFVGVLTQSHLHETFRANQLLFAPREAITPKLFPLKKRFLIATEIVTMSGVFTSKAGKIEICLAFSEKEARPTPLGIRVPLGAAFGEAKWRVLIDDSKTTVDEVQASLAQEYPHVA
jgi:hypothetical protein